MRYATVGPRFSALMTDALILLPLFILIFWMRGKSPQFALVSIILSFLILLYQIYFIATKGQTPGKRISKVRVINVNGSKAGRREAILRVSVTLVLSLLIQVAAFVALTHIPFGTYSTATRVQQSALIAGAQPYSTKMLGYLIDLWIFVDAICFFLNSKRRALQD
ncbi:MAG: RDD family protein [Caldilineaceae bacterium]